MDCARRELYLTAKAFFNAAWCYWHAAERGGDMELPTQELMGRGLFYHEALLSFARQAAVRDAGAALFRVRYLRAHTRYVASRYAAAETAAPAVRKRYASLFGAAATAIAAGNTEKVQSRLWRSVHALDAAHAISGTQP